MYFVFWNCWSGPWKAQQDDLAKVAYTECVKNLETWRLATDGARSLTLCRHARVFEYARLSTELPACWVHIYINSGFLRGSCTWFSKFLGWEHWWCNCPQRSFWVLWNSCTEFQKCMKSNQAKRVMILSHSARQFVHDTSSKNSAEETVISNFNLFQVLTRIT